MENKKIKTIFFGTHEFAATILKALLESPSISVETVITQPDRPAGRNQKIAESPIKRIAKNHDVKLFQPESLKDFNLHSLISNFQLSIVCQYGLIIPKIILDLPKYGTLNIHPSLLPKYRGASPIQTALLSGDKMTGISIMLMDEKMDHGAVISQREVAIDEDDNFTTLSKKLSEEASKFLLEIIPSWVRGEITSIVQDHDKATFTKILARDDGKISFEKTADEIFNLFRGLSPWPGIWTIWNGKRLKLLQIKKSDKSLPRGVIEFGGNNICIGCSNGSIEALELQLEGGKAMDARSFIAGHKDFNGANLK